jgi:hypothetical protein
MIITLPASFVDLAAHLLQRSAELDPAFLGVVLVPLLPDKFTPSGAGIDIHEAQHEPRLAQAHLVEPHRGPQRLGRGGHQPLRVELTVGHADAVARVGRDHPRSHTSVEDGGEQREVRRHRRLGVVLVQLRKPPLDLDIAVENRDQRPRPPLRQQLVVQKRPVLCDRVQFQPRLDRSEPLLGEVAESGLAVTRVQPQVAPDQGFLFQPPVLGCLLGGEA